jgi:hypothetical protein
MSFLDRLASVRERIEAARARSGRRDAVLLLGATKGVSPAVLEEALGAGLALFGENRMQEALPKVEALAGKGAEWHFIGHLQKNKAAAAVERFAMVQSVDTPGLALKLQACARATERILPVLVEINIGGEPAKTGCLPADLPALLETLQGCENLVFQGIMAIPPYHPDPERTRPYFRRMREIFDRLCGVFPRVTTLSMGMTEDFEVAVEEGATMVRVGRALFGERA